MEAQLKKFARDEAGNMTFEPFTANGKTYKFIQPGHPLGINKWGEYQKLMIVAGAGVSFSDLIISLRSVKDLWASDKKVSEIRAEAIVWADSIIKGLIDMSKAKFDKAFYLATLFIYEEGKSPYEWDMEAATAMIEDFSAEGIDEQDLFFFGMLQIPAWREIFSELLEETEKQAARSLVDILLQKMGASS
jgi:hypothetical protein